ncbi:hypothetical protein ABH926_003843 [Catenulispora sp. GP43]
METENDAPPRPTDFRDPAARHVVTRHVVTRHATHHTARRPAVRP